MEHYPEHIAGYAKDATHRFPNDATSSHFYYQLVCTCGGKGFTLFESNLCSVFALCAECGKRITVYDLANYPAAVKLTGDEEFHPLQAQVCRPSTVFVQYEYGAEEDDVEFDQNDITWCEILVELPSGELHAVFDDETA